MWRQSIGLVLLPFPRNEPPFRTAAGRAHRRPDQARAEAQRFPAHDQSCRQRLHLRGLPRRAGEVHDDQHVRRHRRRRAGGGRPGQRAGDQGARRRDQRQSRRSRSSMSSSAPTTATTPPATRRSPPASPTSSTRPRRPSWSARRSGVETARERDARAGEAFGETRRRGRSTSSSSDARIRAATSASACRARRSCS